MPPAVRVPSSVTAPVVVPEMVAASALPVMVTLMVSVSEPSSGVDRQGVVHDLAGGERLHVALAVVERVAPRAGLRVEGEAAVGPRQRGRDLEVVLGAVGVGNAERAARGQGAVFGHRAGRRPGDGGGVVAAGDGDVDGLGVGAVEGVDRQGVVHDLAAGERLHVAAAVGERVAPRAGLRIEGEAAVGPRQRGRDVWKWVSPLSTSATLSVPPAVRVPSSVTAPVVVPEMVAASSVPVMVTLMVSVSEPSTGVTARVSCTIWPAASACTLAAAVGRACSPRRRSAR